MGPMNGGVSGRKQRKRQRTAALQDAVATERTPLLPRGLGVRLSSAALASVRWQAPYSCFHEVR
jgi:hypothetical protein